MGRRIYMDHHATTPVDPRVVAAMLPYFTERPGNPASPHEFGWEAAEAVDRAREQVAQLLGCEPKEVVFTSGATESNNLALRGAMERYQGRGRHLVTTTIEHASVLEPLRDLERAGCEVTRIGVDASGVVDPAAVLSALRPDTVLCSVQWANNEIGTIQPVEEIARGCRERGVLFHTDAAQAAGRIPLTGAAAAMDLVSASAHKLYGPKGIGVLRVRRRRPRVRLAPQLFGGGQQDGLRPGTVPTPLVVGLGEACALAQAAMGTEARRLAGLRDRLRQRLERGLDGVLLNGSASPRLPGNLNMVFLGVEAQAVLLELRGIALSAGSACGADPSEPSHVLRSLGRTDEQAYSSLRFGLGRFNRADEVDTVADALIEVVRRLRRRAPVHEAVRQDGAPRTKGR